MDGWLKKALGGISSSVRSGGLVEVVSERYKWPLTRSIHLALSVRRDEEPSFHKSLHSVESILTTHIKFSQLFNCFILSLLRWL